MTIKTMREPTCFHENGQFNQHAEMQAELLSTTPARDTILSDELCLIRASDSKQAC